MNKKIITFEANEQSLIKTGGISNYSSNKVSYIEAHFELGDNWQGFDAVRAIWYNKSEIIATVLSDGQCTVPYEVLTDKGQVKVNLVGSISEGDVLTDRLTSYPVVAFIVDAEAKVNGSNTQPITPSQFEQFVEAVKEDADRAEQGAQNASASAESASASAESASASAKSAHDDKIEIEQKIAEVIQQIEDFEQVEVVVNTLPAGSQATSDFTDGVLTLGIPQGAKGDTGNGIASCVLNADYTLTINFTDGTSYITTSIRGAQGAKGDTGNGISSITKTGSETVDGRVVDTYTTTFTDGETTEFEVTNGKDGEVTMSQLSALLPTDTASGSIASFTDGTDLFPALSVKAQIEPIQSGSGTPSPDNVRPISGRTECDTHRTPYGSAVEMGTIADSGGEEFAHANRIRTDFIKTNNVSVVDLVGKNDDRLRGIHYYNENKVWLSADTTTAGYQLPYTNSNQPSNFAYVRFVFQHTDPNTAETADGKTAVCDWTSYTTDLGRTVYGGTLEQVGGQLTDKWGKSVLNQNTVWSYSPAWSTENTIVFYADIYSEIYYPSFDYNNYLCETFPTASRSELYSSDTNMIGMSGAVNSAQPTIRIDRSIVSGLSEFLSWIEQNPITLVYPLATPQTYQLDPTEVDLLLGQNNVWTDCGSVEVTYKADIERWVNKKINALI